MTRQPSPTPDTPSSWVGFKELARTQFERGNYEGALTSYMSALNPELNCPASEKQVILSNLAACRLKIGDTAQARAAVENAKKCIELNPHWAKGHVRLASAYIALGGHSNDACNELQRALAIDPGNTTARDMLVRELRRDHSYASRASSTTHQQQQRESSTATNDNSTRFEETGATPRQDYQQQPQQTAAAVDDSLTWSERLQFHVGRATTWYQSQSEDVKTVLKILIGLLILYVAFGGRFGLGNDSRRTGNYGSDSVYDQYRRYGTTQFTTQSSYPYRDSNINNNHNNNYGRSSSNRRRTQQDDDYHEGDYSYYNSGRGRGGGGGGGGVVDGHLVVVDSIPWVEGGSP